MIRSRRTLVLLVAVSALTVGLVGSSVTAAASGDGAVAEAAAKKKGKKKASKCKAGKGKKKAKRADAGVAAKKKGKGKRKACKPKRKAGAKNKLSPRQLRDLKRDRLRGPRGKLGPKGKPAPKGKPTPSGFADGRYSDSSKSVTVEVSGNGTKVRVSQPGGRCGGGLMIALEGSLSTSGSTAKAGDSLKIFGGAGTVSWQLTLQSNLRYTLTASWTVAFPDQDPCAEQTSLSGVLQKA